MGWKWKKPKWVQNIQKKADNIVKPITTSAPVKTVQRAATNTFVKPIQKIAKKLPPPPPKPRIVQQVQKAAQKTADKVGQGAKDVAKQTGQAVTKAADKVGDVVRPAAQSVAKEVGHMVNPAIGEVALRGKQIAKASTPVLKRIGDKLGDAGRAVGDALLGGYTAVNPMRTGSQGFSLTGDVPTEQTKRSQFLPFFTKILPDAIGDTAKGVLRTGKGLLTADGGEIVSGIKRTGRGLGDTLKHTGLGTLEVLSGGFAKRGGDTIDGSGAGGQGPVQNKTPGEKTSSPEVVETPQQKAQREEDEKTLAEYGQEAWDKFKDFSKMVIDEGIKPGFDSIDVKTKRTRYKDVASDAEIEVYRRAEAAGDKKLQDMMEAQWQYRQKYGRDYADDLMQGRTYQK